ncbi:hypothetical protein K227x_33830 [Rubripirellula lacrimiformis]|uniref:Secreted protein n=1 Tax=Rubripirellula lacrimiformis TaxID=1930273 RepID=A0A517NCX3_9BACT|nr:hypothetical protein [Rubripirellula lacrimiformis]QDT04985.1 hypothetical protein K227x_33830 [Rubripirellula lacrimiformis]
MKRAFAIAAIAVGLFAITQDSEATAADYFHGGHGGHHGHHGSYQAGYQSGYRGGYSPAPVQAYHGRPGYSANYGSQQYGYGQSYRPRVQSRYAPSYSTPQHRQHGGLHLDIGRFHILGVGGHH